MSILKSNRLVHYYAGRHSLLLLFGGRRESKPITRVAIFRR
eukprot:COSAG06_NODE_49646_length_324_cov_0.617778_1_plen_40_part_10